MLVSTGAFGSGRGGGGRGPGRGVARTGPGWRRTLGSGGVALHRIGLASERWPLADDAVIAELQQGFGIRVPAHPGLHAAIEAWLGSGASSST